MCLSKPIVKTKSKSIQMNGEQMYLRLLAINAFKKVPLQRVLSFENAPVPLSLFTDEGCIMMTKKSDFLDKLEGLIKKLFVLLQILLIVLFMMAWP